MFFSKKQPLNQIPEKYAIIAGTSPLAFWLADCLQNRGCRVHLLTGGDITVVGIKNKGMVIKISDFQSRQVSFEFVDEPDARPDCCLLAPMPAEKEVVGLLIKNSRFKEVPLLDFTLGYSCIKTEENDEMTANKVCFNGWLNREKGVVELLSRNPEIIIDEDSQMKSAAAELFAGTPVDVVPVKNRQLAFRRQAEVVFLVNLLTLAYEKSIGEVLKDEQSRKKVEVAVDELAKSLENGEAELLPDGILTQIYTVPGKYNSVIKTAADFYGLIRLFPVADRFAFPVLNELIDQAVKKYKV